MGGLTALDRFTWVPLLTAARAIAFVAIATAVFGVLAAQAIESARSA